MKCLVTGGAGFIGSNLALHLEKLGHSVTIVDNFNTGNRENLSGFKGKIVEGDVCTFESAEKFDVIFHQAALTDPRYPDDAEMLRQNMEGFGNMLSLAKKCHAKFIYASSASLYGNGPAPQKEDQPKDILSAYAKSKLQMDEIAEKEKSLHIVGLRYFNVFGPREKFKGRAASMIHHLAKQLKEGKTPKLFKHGEHRRDHIYVMDCVLANIKALDAPSGVYNVGTGIGTSFNDVLKTIAAGLGKKAVFEYINNPYEGSYQKHTQADTSKAEKALKFKAKYTLEQGVREYLPWV